MREVFQKWLEILIERGIKLNGEEGL
jgi:hypothetical protein